MKFLKTTMFVSFIFAAQAASAHFQLGKYEGVLLNGEKCQIEIKNVSFESNQKHPLNERVAMHIGFRGNELIETRHLAQIDAVQGTVRPKHGVLSNVQPFTGGAQAYELIMNEEGPVQMIYLLDNYKNPDANERVTCAELKYIGK